MKKYTLGIYEKAMPDFLSWKEKLELAKEVGYDFVEMSIDETKQKLSRLDMPKSARLELVQLMYEIGFPIRSLCLSAHRKYPLGSKDEKTVQRSLEIMEKAITLADDLGIRIIMLAGYDVYYDTSDAITKQRFIENLKKAVLMASAKGIILGFETMETSFMNTVEKAMQYVSTINSKYLGVYPDAGNITNAAKDDKQDVLEDLKKGIGHLYAMHLKETMPGKFREIPYGTGHVDFTHMIDTAWDLGIRRYVTEFWYVQNDDWKEAILDAYQRMSMLLDNKE